MKNGLPSPTHEKSAITLLDGAIGSMLRCHGMPLDVVPELWCLAHRDRLEQLHHDYVEAGADAIRTATFGAGPLTLASRGVDTLCEQINAPLVAVAKKAALPHVQLGGCMGPVGYSLDGSSEQFERFCEHFAIHARALADAGVDYLAVETITDLNEARAALIGARSVCALPIQITLYFSEGQTVCGDAPASCAIALEALGADAIGINCGDGLDSDVPVIEEMARHTTCPLIAKPSAGLPEIVAGQPIYHVTADEFCTALHQYILAGAQRIGGCCGSTPAFIAQMRTQLDSLRFFPRPTQERHLFSSRSRHVDLDNTFMIGNLRANANPAFFKQVQQGIYFSVVEAIEQLGDSEVLCLTAIGEGIDEKQALLGLARVAWENCPLPLAFRPESPQALELALREYPGRALVVLDCADIAQRQKIGNIAARYGAICIL